MSEDGMTIAECVAYYLENLRCKRPESVRAQVRNVSRLIGSLLAADLRGHQLDEYRRDRRQEGVSDSTVNRELGYLRAGMNLCHAADLIDRVPKFRMLREPPGPQDWMTRDQLESVAKVLDLADPLGDYARMAFCTGWRRTAIASLTWADVDWDRRILSLPARISKAGIPGQFPIEGEVHEILLRRRERREYDGVIIPWLFHRSGAQVRQFDKRWKRALRIRGLEGIRFHALRASFVLHYVDKGIEDTVIRRLCQMSRQTFDRYRRMRPEDLRNAVLRVAEA